MSFYIFIISLILLRLVELLVSKRNEVWLLKNGAKEYGKNHYPFIVSLHIFFILSLLIEYSLKTAVNPEYFLMYLFIVLILFKANIIYSLGYFWNTKIFHIKGAKLVRKGLYQHFSHPNYFIVVCEILVIPLIFHLYFTAIVFSILNGIMLYIRIKVENKALKEGF